MPLVSSFTVFLCKRIEYANIRNMWIQKVKNTIFFFKKLLSVAFSLKIVLHHFDCFCCCFVYFC